MDNTGSSTDEPPATMFSNEDGLDWFWCGDFTAQEALDQFANDPEQGDEPATITTVRANVRSGVDEFHDYYLDVHPGGRWEFWQVEGGVY